MEKICMDQQLDQKFIDTLKKRYESEIWQNYRRLSLLGALLLLDVDLLMTAAGPVDSVPDPGERREQVVYHWTTTGSQLLKKLCHRKKICTNFSHKGCSLNIVFFSKNSQKFATSPSPVLGCYWLYNKLPTNGSDCKLALRWELWMSLTAM